jgi:nucleotide-binding universal stress UspA family protein
MKIKPSAKFRKLVLEVNARTEPRLAAALFKAARKLPAIRFKKILAATDFSDLSMRGVQYAISLGNKLGAAVTLIHVVKPSSHFTGTESALLLRDDLEVLELAERDLSKIAETLSKNNLVVNPLVRYGQPFNEIAMVARTRGMDLVVIATHGRTGLKRLLLGSTAERVVRHTPCPVLTIPSRSLGPKAPPFRLRKILIPIDFSETSVQALPYAAALAERFEAEVVLLHVLEPLPMPPDSGYIPQTQGVDEAAQQAAHNHLLRLSEVFSDTIATKTLVRVGLPFQEIAGTAKSLAADLITLTTHGYTGLTHVLLGSTAERVVRHADCPVLTVRDPSGREEQAH